MKCCNHKQTWLAYLPHCLPWAHILQAAFLPCLLTFVSLNCVCMPMISKPAWKPIWGCGFGFETMYHSTAVCLCYGDKMVRNRATSKAHIRTWIYARPIPASRNGAVKMCFFEYGYWHNRLVWFSSQWICGYTTPNRPFLLPYMPYEWQLVFQIDVIKAMKNPAAR